MKEWLIFWLLFSIANAYDLSYQQFLASTPTTFGFLTVTYARNGDYRYFKSYLERYVTMQCPALTEISVVWNNEITPQAAGIIPNRNWKRPVYFYQSPHNSMDNRYYLPKESTAQVFFSIDDDIFTDCLELMRSFKVWQSKAIGDVAPLMGYGPRGYNFNQEIDDYQYVDPQSKNYYSITLIGVAWVPRFFFNLYTSTKNTKISQLRQIVREKNNCDDIALNFIVSFFFPELIPIPIKGNLKFKSPKVSQSTSQTHYTFRRQCLKQFTQILGYNPLRIVSKKDRTQFRSEPFKNSLILYMKRKMLAEELIEGINTDFKFPTEPKVESNKADVEKLFAEKDKQINELDQKLSTLKKKYEQLENQKKNSNSHQVKKAATKPNRNEQIYILISEVEIFSILSIIALVLIVLLLRLTKSHSFVRKPRDEN